MKRFLMIALLIGAIPAVAVGQTVSCDECTHVASVYMGEGGFIATADDADMVTWVATCDGVTRSGELAPNDDGVVAALWTGDLACMAEGGGSFEVGPVMDGGWFWVTDADNSAVGGLVADDVLMNDTADITSAGAGVTMMEGKGAVYLKEAATGRVGILPNILPEMPMEALRRCGYDTGGTAAAPTYSVRNSGCALGDRGHIILATTTNGFTGATEQIMDKGVIYRPAGTASTILVDLWGNMSGFFTSTADDEDGATFGDDPRLGNPAVAKSTARANLRMGHATASAVSYTVSVSDGSGPGGGTRVFDNNPGRNTADDAEIAADEAGVSAAAPTGTGNLNNAIVVSVGPDSAYCSARNNYSANVKVDVQITAAAAGEITPPLKRHATSGAVGSLSFTVMCQSGASSMHQGQELVPENLFPTE